MRVGIFSRPGLEKAASLVEELLKVLDEEEVYLSSEISDALDVKPEVENKDLDALVTIGGDGTVLHNIRKKPEVPVLGINMGGRGFLADVNPDEATEAVQKMVDGELEIIERERLSVYISGEHLADALNEGTLRSKSPTGTISFTIYINGEEVETVEGDGLIVSTPTGSTAYALAAGGPVLDPGVEAFSIVPLSILHSKVLPLVFPMSRKLEIKLQEGDRKASVTVDGHVTKEAGDGGVVSFERSEVSGKFYKWKGKFYEKIGEKL